MTQKDLEAVMRSGCGLKRAQAIVLGLPWPLKRGWKEQVIGMQMDEATYNLLMDVRPKMPRNKSLRMVGLILKNCDVFLKRRLLLHLETGCLDGCF